MEEEEQLKKELTALREENKRLNQFQGSTVAHAREKIRDLNNERLDALEKVARLESDVKRYREALEIIAKDNKFKEGEYGFQYVLIASSALSEGGSE